MGKFKNKIYDWKDRLRKGKMFTLVTTLVVIITVLGVYALKKGKDYRQLAENSYNEAFYELIEYMNNTEKLLAKATITGSKEHEAKILTSIWRTSTLAQSYLSRIPIEVQDLENTQKFLNQVGDYCFSLSKKNIEGQDLTQGDLDNLSKLHEYSVQLTNTVNQLESELYLGQIKWGELNKKGDIAFSQENNNLSIDSFMNIEEDLHQYTGLIYDGAFSENQSSIKGNGLVGDEINEEKAKEIAENFIGKDKIKETIFKGEIDNANIKCYEFDVEINNETNTTIAISKKGGHLVYMNNSRNVEERQINNDEAGKKGNEFLQSNNYNDMQETYYMEEGNVLTINYAYTQEINQNINKNENESNEENQKDKVIIYPDLIKVKIAMDNGEILGIETKNYLNNHIERRNFKTIKIQKNEALQLVNKNLLYNKIDLAMIPTEYNTEILCWEIKGRAFGNDFLVYINAENGKEEDILMIVDTPNGRLTA